MDRAYPQLNSDRPLGGRYRVVTLLGAGGFGRTFLAEDMHLPGHPRCVVKQLKPEIKNDATLLMARRCFNTEAEVLYQLGNHDQIPQLLAHFEDNHEFYLAQEFIEGQPLTYELVEGRPWSEERVISLLRDLLQVLAFVHQQKVIHRDIKPSNLIRRKRDHRLVLIDFGAVKQVGTQNFEPESGLTNLTISIGTKGYMPNEQIAGKPRYSSDLFALGIIGIQAITGIHPRHLEEDPRGEIAWHYHAPQISPEVKQVLDCMVRYDFRERYLTAVHALESLEQAIVARSERAAEAAEAGTGDYATADDVQMVGDPTIAEPTHGEEPSHFIPSTGVTSGVKSPSSIAASNPQISNPQTASPRTSNPRTSNPRTPKAHSASSSLSHFPIDPETEMPEDASLSTALWTPSESFIQSAVSQSSLTQVPTQAVGRPYPTANTTVAEPPRRRSRLPLALLVGGVTTAIAVVLGQALLPQIARFTDGMGPASSIIRANSLPVDPAKRSVELVKQAGDLLKSGKHEAALQAYDEAIELRTDYAEAYAGRCETLNRLNRPDDAMVACNDALAFKPDYPEAIWSRGNALMLRERTLEALRLYEEVTVRKPDFAQAWVRRGVALQKLGRSAEALSALDKAIKLYRNSSEAWTTRGAALLTLQRYEEATIALDKALQLDPKNAQAQDLRQQAREAQS